MKWIQFPNGKVWKVVDAAISGSVIVPEYEAANDPDTQLEMIAEAATGSRAGLTRCVHSYRGDCRVAFSGDVTEMLEGDFEDCIELTSAEARVAVAKQYGLTDAEIAHAWATLGDRYGNEYGLAVIGTQRELRFPADPNQRDYVRCVVNGLETAFWGDTEWIDAPADVLGAILASVRGSVRDAHAAAVASALRGKSS